MLAVREGSVYRYTFKPATERAGLAGLHFRELRHTFATMALANGMPMFDGEGAGLVPTELRACSPTDFKAVNVIMRRVWSSGPLDSRTAVRGFELVDYAMKAG